MHPVKEQTLIDAYKPFDIVSNKHGHVGFIQEVSVNTSQVKAIHQIGYAVEWLVGTGDKHAWFKHEELTYHCNMFIKIAQAACHPFSTGAESVQLLFNSMDR